MKTQLLLVAVGLTLAAGCSGGSGSRADTVPDQPTETNAAPATGGQTVTRSDLQAALLETNDLPTGFSPNPDLLGGKVHKLCNATYSIADKGKAEVGFAKSNFGPFVVESLRLFPDAERTLNASTRAATSCSKWTDSDGARYTIAALSFPRVGDQTLAVRLSATGPDGTSFDGPVVFWRRGNVIAQVVETSAAGADTDLLLRMVRRADERLRSAMSG